MSVEQTGALCDENDSADAESSTEGTCAPNRPRRPTSGVLI